MVLYVACFGVFYYITVCMWQPFRKELFTRLTISSLLCVFVFLVVSHLDFVDGNLVLLSFLIFYF